LAENTEKENGGEKLWTLRRKGAEEVIPPVRFQIAFVALALAGCAGPSNVAGAPAQLLSGTVREARVFDAGKFAGEAFSSNRTSDKCGTTPEFAYLDFLVKGKATGPFPGKFIAHGILYYWIMKNRFTFTESFVVLSGSHTIPGTATGSGSGISFSSCYSLQVTGAAYKVRRWRGQTSLESEQKAFSQTFN
jgi:hypothetical protein